MKIRWLNQKIKEWIIRYLPAEIIGSISAITTGLAFHVLFNNPLITAIAATMGENIGYYYLFVIEEIRKIKKPSIISIFIVFRNLLMEFSIGEYFDSFVIRPSAMYYFPLLFNNVIFGIVVGKLVADITFYIPTIISYEIKKKIIK